MNNKKSMVFVSLLLIALCVIGIGSYLYKRQVQFIGEKSIDFGDVEAGGEIEGNFIVTNNNDFPLSIKKISKSCGCIISAHIEKTEISPHGSSILRFTWDAPNYETTVFEEILLETDDPTQKNYSYSFKANIISKIALSDTNVNFGIIEQSDLPKTNVLKVDVSKTKKNEQLNVVVKNNESLQAVLNPIDNNSHQLSLILDENAPIGPLVGEIELKTSSEENKRIPLLGTVIGDVRCEPIEVYENLIQSPTGNQVLELVSEDSEEKINEVSIVEISDSIQKTVEIEVNQNRVFVTWDSKESKNIDKFIKGYLLLNVRTNQGISKVCIPVTFTNI